MSQSYLLPCECGRRLSVDASHAGLSLSCDCGRTLTVPSLLGLRQLAPAPRPVDPSRPRSEMWGPRQGLMFLGFLLAVPALSWAAVQFASLTTPEDQFSIDYQKNVTEVSQLSAAQSWELWQVMRDGINRDEHPRLKDARLLHARALRRVGVATAFGVLGIALIAGGFLIRTSQRL